MVGQCQIEYEMFRLAPREYTVCDQMLRKSTGHQDNPGSHGKWPLKPHVQLGWLIGV